MRQQKCIYLVIVHLKRLEESTFLQVVVKLISRVVFVLRKMEKALFVCILLRRTIQFQELSWICRQVQ